MKTHQLKALSTHRANRNEKGFTLVEIMIAVCVLGVGLLAIASMQLGAVNANSDARGVTEAAALGELQMETLMTLPYRFELALDNQNHAELQETSATFDPTDLTGLGLFNPFPVNRSIFNQTAYDIANPAANTYPPDHWRIDGNYTIMWNISTDLEIENTKTVQVVVAWNDNGIIRTLILRRVIPRIT